MEIYLPDFKPYLVALSGGADSVCLFHLTAAACRERGEKFYAAHVNHGIRGDEALRDRDFCVRLAEGCPECEEIFVLNVDVPALAAESGRSLETEARAVRYEFFERVMKAHGIKTLLTAHNASDNLETLIFNLTRGTGPRGMCGIPSTRELCRGCAVERPLLTYSKAQILAECEKNSWEYVTDSTNADTNYSRNLIRHEVIPLLEQINPAVVRSATRFSELMRQFCDSIEIEECVDGAIPIDTVRQTPRAYLSALFSRELAPSLEKVHFDALFELCEKGVEGSSVSLPHKMCAIIRNNNLVFLPQGAEKIASEDYEVELCEGENALPDGSKLIILRLEGQDPNIYKFATRAKLDFDTISLKAKNRRAGDRIMLRGVHRELRKLFSEWRMPHEQRPRIPVVSDGGEIICVPGYGVADKVFSKKECNALIAWEPASL